VRGPRALSRILFGGLGWGIERTEKGVSLWHWGDNGAFKCFVAAKLKDKTAIVMFTNSENGLAIAKPIVHDAIGGQQLAFTWIKYDRSEEHTSELQSRGHLVCRLLLEKKKKKKNKNIKKETIKKAITETKKKNIS